MNRIVIKDALDILRDVDVLNLRARLAAEIEAKHRKP